MELTRINVDYQLGLIDYYTWSDKYYELEKEEIAHRQALREQELLQETKKLEDELIAEVEEMIKEEIPEPQRGSGHNDSISEVKNRESREKQLVK